MAEISWLNFVQGVAADRQVRRNVAELLFDDLFERLEFLVGLLKV